MQLKHCLDMGDVIFAKQLIERDRTETKSETLEEAGHFLAENTDAKSNDFFAKAQTLRQSLEKEGK